MSSPRSDSRTNSVYVDAPEFPADHTDETVANSTTTAASSHHVLTATSQVRSPAPEPSARTPLPTGDDDDEGDDSEDDEDEDEESEGGDGDQVDAHMSEDRGRSQRGRTPNAASTEEEEDEDDDEEMVMQVDPATGLHRATSIPRVRSRSSSLVNRLRRQHQRMTTSSGSSSRVGRPTSSTGSRSGSGQQAGQPPAARPNAGPLVDEKDQAELRRKIMDIQRDPTISFADKASMIQVRQDIPFLCLPQWKIKTRGGKHLKKRPKCDINICTIGTFFLFMSLLEIDVIQVAGSTVELSITND